MLQIDKAYHTTTYIYSTIYIERGREAGQVLVDGEDLSSRPEFGKEYFQFFPNLNVLLWFKLFIRATDQPTGVNKLSMMTNPVFDLSCLTIVRETDVATQEHDKEQR